MVSIILPVFNGEKYLSQAIESCLNQTYDNIELIIVNDCSTDSSLTIASKYAASDSRIKIINNKENKKLPVSLNIGHNNSTGDLITWISDDNILKPNFIEILLKSIKTEKVDIVYSDYDIIFYDGRLKRKHNAGPTEHLLYGNKIGPSFLYKRHVFNTLKGYREQLYLLEDYDFWLRASLKFNFFHINENLYQYRLHQNSLTENINKNRAIREQHNFGLNIMFSDIASVLSWNDSTKKIIIANHLKNENLIQMFLLNKKTIIKDILKIESKTLDKEKIILGLLEICRDDLINNNINYNFMTFFDVLIKEKELLFHKSFSKKVTLNYLKNIFIK